MQTETTYKFDFLNHYFTTKEFDFINNIRSENKKYDDIIMRNTQIRDVLVSFINNLNDSISNNEQVNVILQQAKDIFNLMNYNIQSIQNLKSTSLQISDDIVKLLVEIESNSCDHSVYNTQIQELKNRVLEFSNKDEKIKEEVSSSELKADSFFEQDIVKQYLSELHLDIDFLKNKEVKMNTDVVESISKNTISHVTLDDTDIAKFNNTLLVSEKAKKVFLPYKESEVLLYLEQYPKEYKSFADVVKKEFILPLDYYMKHPIVARFRESYSLIRDRESKMVIDAFKFALNMMFRYEVNPVIIAACKTQSELENYLSCLEKNHLEDFIDFEIKFEVNPLA